MPKEFTVKKQDAELAETSTSSSSMGPLERLRRLRESASGLSNEQNSAPETAGAPDLTTSEADALERLKRLNEEAGAVLPASSFARASEQVSEAARTTAEADALERLARFNENLRARPAPAPPAPETVSTQSVAAEVRPPRSGPAIPSRKIIKSVLALLVAVALAWVPAQRLFTTRSAEATINARLVNLRAPIDGTVEFLSKDLMVGTLVDPGQPLLRLVNARADRQRLDDLRRNVSSLRTESASLERRIERMKQTRDDLAAQSNAFQQSRVLQLEARDAELRADVKAAEAHLEDAIKSYNRSKDLKERGIQTVATLLHAERDMKVGETKVEAARKRLDGNKVELDGARKGFFVGDSYNDVPRSSQRLDEVEQQLADLTSQLEDRQAQLAAYSKDLTVEQKLFEHNSTAVVDATSRGRVWELLTTNGESVRAGQDLMRILDCGATNVTATVSESVYNELWVGQPVEFRLRGASKPLAGSVAALTGLTPAGTNMAIAQSALTREPYHVTLAVPALASSNECNVGRMGSVTFNTSATPAVAGQPPAANLSAAGGASNAARHTALALDIGRTGHQLIAGASRSLAALTLTAGNALKAFKPARNLP